MLIEQTTNKAEDEEAEEQKRGRKWLLRKKNRKNKQCEDREI